MTSSRTQRRTDSGRRRGPVLLALTVIAVLVVAGLLIVPRLLGPAPERPEVDPGVPFGSRPVSKPIVCRDDEDVVIRDRTFRAIDDRRPAITVQGCSRVVIEHNDFIDVAEPIYVQGSKNVVIRENRYHNITGPHERDGSHRGNFTQWDESYGGQIVGNVGIGGDTEDIISIYKSGGLSAAEPLVIAHNHFQGTDWTSASGSGILLGDGGGSHVVVRDNVLVDVGQVGIGVAGGNDITLLRNTIYGSKREHSNVGIYAWGQGAACSDIEIRGNSVDFTKADGTPAPVYDNGNCGAVAGLTANRFAAALNPAKLQVRLPAP